MATEIKHQRSITGQGVEEFVRMLARQRRGAFRVPSETASAPILRAEVNHGRWIVRCPFCAGAELADPDDPRFFCCGCHNSGVDGRWLPVQWPAERQGIEDALCERNEEEHRNWLPHESVIDLLAQTLERQG